MALAYDQQTVQARSAGVDSLQQTTGQAVDAGDLVVVCVSTWFANGTPGTWVVTDDASQTYTEAIDTSNQAQQGQVAIFYKENHPGGTIKVTVNPDGSSADIDFTVSEVSGAATSGALDKTAANSSAGTSVATGVLSQANEIIFGIYTHQGATSTLSPDTAGGYTEIGENENNAGGQCYNAQYKIVASTASDTADWTGPSGECCVATFKEAAAGAAAKAHPALLAGPAAWCP